MADINILEEAAAVTVFSHAISDTHSAEKTFPGEKLPFLVLAYLGHRCRLNPNTACLTKEDHSQLIKELEDAALGQLQGEDQRERKERR